MHIEDELMEESVDLIKEELKTEQEPYNKLSLNPLKISSMKMKIREKLVVPCEPKPLSPVKKIKMLRKKPKPINFTIRNETETKSENLVQPKAQTISQTLTNNGKCVSTSENLTEITRNTKNEPKTVSRARNFRPRNAAIQFKEQHLKNPSAARQMWRVATAVIEQQKKVIANLESKNERLCKRNKLLEAALDDIQNSANTPGNCYILLKKPGEYFIKWG
ncbi:hypothetical protein TcasGA2_TC005497 [Tribolium castaneum]|uniref:Uncharacterized protein n=1 Tax=Tribolium castaneum TaxID=7070 RepID=D6WXZ4_TRICA|nr:hypothetical protein TcasGA2_TC005497 [Tribolium castaneum]